MDKPRDEIESSLIRAAGGVVWRDSPDGRQIAIIRRTRHGDEWTLPKGKLEPGESWSQAALREVTEETGCEVTLGPVAGCHAYLVNGRPKLVLFWNMDFVRAGEPGDSREVKELRWVTIPEALRDLKHPGEKRVLGEIRETNTMIFGSRLKTWVRRFWLSAAAQRLGESLTCYSIELPLLIQQANAKNSGMDAWATSALALLEEAKKALKEGDEDRGWHCFMAAQRMELQILRVVNPAAFQLRGQTLYSEALHKLKSWRKERVQDLLRPSSASSRAQPADPEPPDFPDGGGSPPPTPPWRARGPISPDEISEIADILHRHFDNEAFKSREQRKHLQRLIIVGLTLVGLWFVLLFFSPNFREKMDQGYDVGDPHLTLAVMLFGVLGASLSGILSTLGDPGKLKIPELLFSFRVTLARLVVGLLSAVIASVLLTSGFLQIGKLNPTPKVILLAALVAGFSERLVTSALKKAAGD